jgi:septum site-determining protein MinC
VNVATAAIADVGIQPRHSLRFRGRSFMALVLAPEAPLDAWMAELDQWGTRFPGFFLGRPAVLDVSGLPHDKESLAKLVTDLFERDVRILGVEGTKGSWLGLGMPPLINGGRDAELKDLPQTDGKAGPTKPGAGESTAAAAAKPALRVAPAEPAAPALLHDSPLRSGQSLFFPEGDVTIIGAVASGAEVVAGGSIHVYGALRGRAIAGTTGNSKARIFCNKLEAELLAIDGLYRTADEMDPEYRGKAVQAWLSDDAMKMTALT